jgi:UDPglucose 6-dehydrogenase
MRLVTFGVGYVGLVQGTGMAELGHDVFCVDISEERINALLRGEIPIYEPGLADLVRRNVRAGRLSFGTTIPPEFLEADAYFIAVGTPPLPDGSADVSAVLQVGQQIAALARREAVVVVKSTVPVGTCASLQEAIGVGSLEVVSNPEFLKEGAALQDFFHPDRIVLGARGPRALEVLRKLYAPLQLVGDKIISTDPQSSELTKYAANTMLAMRISFMNELSRLCHATGANIKDIRLGVGSDSRIGDRFLYAGPGFGGSCLHGQETVLVRQHDHVRLIRLAHLFREIADDWKANSTQAKAVKPKGLEVFALSKNGPRFLPCAVMTRRPYEGDVLHLKTKMGRRLTCTPDHPFVTVDSKTGRRGQKLACDLTDQDWLPVALTPTKTKSKEYVIDVLDAIPLAGLEDDDVIVRLDEADRALVAAMSHGAIAKALNHKRGRERSHDIKKAGALRLDEAKKLGLKLKAGMFGTATNGTYIPRKLHLDEQFWLIAGLYSAEGHHSVDGRRRRLSWSFHPRTEQALVDTVANYWRQLGVKCDVWFPPTSMQVTVSSRLLATIFVDILRLGTESYNKRVPDIAWTISSRNQQAFLAGAYQGDGGWDNPNNGPSVMFEHSTVSKELADGMIRLLANNGIMASLTMTRMNKSTRDTWLIEISGANQIERAIYLVKPEERDTVLRSIARQKKRIAPTGYRCFENGSVAVRVVKKETRPHRGPVFSMEIPGADTIVTSFGLVTHNCFPKDVSALIKLGEKHEVDMLLATAALDANRKQGEFLSKLTRIALGDLNWVDGKWNQGPAGIMGKKVAFWGLAFKPETDDVRDAPSIRLASDLIQGYGVHISGHDPEAGPNFSKAFADYQHPPEILNDQYATLKDADVLVLLTEWRNYLAPNWGEVARQMKGKAVIDARNVWRPSDVTRAGLTYQGIGIPKAP